METIKIKKQGISLIVLVITIIVMIILAAAIILSLSSNGIIDRANDAVKETNLSQVKTIAQTIWSDVYLENLERDKDKKLDYQTEVINRLTAQKIDVAQYDIEANDSGVIVKLRGDGDWTTIYEKNIATTNGAILISDRNIFETNVRYRITIENFEPIETVPVLIGNADGNSLYALMFVGNDRLIGLEGANDFDEKSETLSDNVILALGIFMFENSECAIVFEGAEKEYTITKIEKSLKKIPNEYGFYYNTFYIGQVDNVNYTVYFKENNICYVHAENEDTLSYISYWETTGERKLTFNVFGYKEINIIDEKTIEIETLGEFKAHNDYKLKANKLENGLYSNVLYLRTVAVDDAYLERALYFSKDGEGTSQSIRTNGEITLSFTIDEYIILNDGKSLEYIPKGGSNDTMFAIPLELYDIE